MSLPADDRDEIVMANSGHGTEFQGLVHYNRATKTYSVSHVPTMAYAEGGSAAIDEYGRFPDGSLYIGHTYGAVQYKPAFGEQGPRWVWFVNPGTGVGPQKNYTRMIDTSNFGPAGSAVSPLNVEPYSYNGKTTGGFYSCESSHWVGHGWFVTEAGRYEAKMLFQSLCGSMHSYRYA